MLCFHICNLEKTRGEGGKKHGIANPLVTNDFNNKQ